MKIRNYNYPKAHGVIKYMRMCGITDDKKHRQLVNVYCTINDIQADTFKRKCKAIQESFGDFITYINQYLNA